MKKNKKFAPKSRKKELVERKKLEVKILD